MQLTDITMDEIEMTMDNTEILYNTIMYPGRDRNNEYYRELTGEVLMVMSENKGYDGLVNDFIGAVDTWAPSVAAYAKTILAEQ